MFDLVIHNKNVLTSDKFVALSLINNHSWRKNYGNKKEQMDKFQNYVLIKISINI